MPLKPAHLAQAAHNHDFLKTINLSIYPDWGSTVLFYIALQYIDAFLATRNVHPPKHAARDVAVANSTELAPIYNEYRKLKNDSFNARYYPPFKQNKAY